VTKSEAGKLKPRLTGNQGDSRSPIPDSEIPSSRFPISDAPSSSAVSNGLTSHFLSNNKPRTSGKTASNKCDPHTRPVGLAKNKQKSSSTILLHCPALAWPQILVIPWRWRWRSRWRWREARDQGPKNADGISSGSVAINFNLLAARSQLSCNSSSAPLKTTGRELPGNNATRR